MGMGEKEFNASQAKQRQEIEHYAVTEAERAEARLNKPTRYYFEFVEGENLRALGEVRKHHASDIAFANIQKPKMDQVDPKRPNEGMFLELSQVSKYTLEDLKRFFERHNLHLKEYYPMVHEQAREIHPREFTMTRKQADVLEFKPKPKKPPESPDIHAPKAA